MSRSRHHGCGRACGVCSPDARQLLAHRAAKAPKIEPDDLAPTCLSCGAETDGYCECGDGPQPDDEMRECGYELRRDTTRYGGTVTVTTERWWLV